jgi:hydrogenase nickel incorporation protein HypA/HybF
MHELSVTQNLLDLALRHANQAGAVRINQLYVVIGELASIVDDSVQFYWDMISQDSIAQGSKLNFKRLPATLRCNDCGTESPLNRSEYVCPACGSEKLVVVGGQEFYLESIDVDLAPEETNA